MQQEKGFSSCVFSLDPSEEPLYKPGVHSSRCRSREHRGPTLTVPPRCPPGQDDTPLMVLASQSAMMAKRRQPSS